MNILPLQKRERIRELVIYQRLGVRAVARELGIAKGTAQRYVGRLVRLYRLKCGCGRPLLHKGWCKVRFARSPARQATVASFRRGAAEGAPE